MNDSSDQVPPEDATTPPEKAASTPPGPDTRPPAVAKAAVPPPQGPHPAVQPGVVPLRPLRAGEILHGAVATMRNYWRTILTVSLGVSLVTQTLGTVALGVWLRDHAEALQRLREDPEPSLDETMDAMRGMLVGNGVTAALGLLGTLVATGMLTMVVSRAVLGRPARLFDTWRDTRSQLLPLLGLLLLIPLLAFGVLCVGALPGAALTAAGSAAGGLGLSVLGILAATGVMLWLLVLFSLAPPALMLEKQGVAKALRRSAKLVRGSWWRVLGIQLLAVLVTLMVSGVLNVPTDLIGRAVAGEDMTGAVSGDIPTGWAYLTVSAAGGVVASTLTLPISAGVTALLYLDQRIRRESLDVQLARAAGVPGFTDRS